MVAVAGVMVIVSRTVDVAGVTVMLKKERQSARCWAVCVKCDPPVPVTARAQLSCGHVQSSCSIVNYANMVLTALHAHPAARAAKGTTKRRILIVGESLLGI